MTAAMDWADDDALIDALLLAGPTGTGPYDWATVCRWCDHREHGLRCGTSCPCDGHNVTRTDDWRPFRAFSPLSPTLLMHNYGLDGYAAHAVAGTAWKGKKYEPSNAYTQARNVRIRRIITNPGSAQP